jgi:hypothetical protein
VSEEGESGGLNAVSLLLACTASHACLTIVCASMDRPWMHPLFGLRC